MSINKGFVLGMLDIFNNTEATMVFENNCSITGILSKYRT